MKKLAICILGCVVLTGCSELQVIGKATLREFAADTISVETERYKARPAKKHNDSQTLVAKASMLDGKLAKAERKELWRNN
ncbi:hypothetical protein KI809_17385 [Geobacter pelophilus]|jgi:hypothetical protein|uniref:Uncharacterized protein n=1 Tax=Geoanaerobacter pelophilus TaxID=60036 RepID=A0AAW4L5A8_9BACT|nr:hypothetical protein [Geoanaerobacter pelophilus]MBT0666088.1 hypothetical protein [Geoanaerobacter pelophilus]